MPLSQLAEFQQRLNRDQCDVLSTRVWALCLLAGVPVHLPTPQALRYLLAPIVLGFSIQPRHLILTEVDEQIL